MKYPKQLRSRGKKLESNIVFIKYFARFTTNATGNNGTTNTTTNNNNDNNNNNIITYNIRSFYSQGMSLQRESKSGDGEGHGKVRSDGSALSSWISKSVSLSDWTSPGGWTKSVNGQGMSGRHESGNAANDGRSWEKERDSASAVCATGTQLKGAQSSSSRFLNALMVELPSMRIETQEEKDERKAKALASRTEIEKYQNKEDLEHRPGSPSVRPNLLAVARKLTTSREMLVCMTPSEAPKALQASECSELSDGDAASAASSVADSDKTLVGGAHIQFPVPGPAPLAPTTFVPPAWSLTPAKRPCCLAAVAARRAEEKRLREQERLLLDCMEAWECDEMSEPEGEEAMARWTEAAREKARSLGRGPFAGCSCSGCIRGIAGSCSRVEASPKEDLRSAAIRDEEPPEEAWRTK